MRGRRRPTTSWRENQVRHCKGMSELCFHKRDTPVVLTPALCLTSLASRIPAPPFARLSYPFHAAPR
jgi:hypothetical protein